MRGNWVRLFVLPVLLAAALGACASNAVQPGIVSTSGPPPAGAGPYGTGPVQASYPAQGSTQAMPGIGESGRVVSIQEVGLQGAGGSGGGQGVMIGGLLGAVGGAVIGAVTSQSLGGGIVGAVLGAVGGAIGGTILDGQRGAGRGIEIVVQRDDGQRITIAQRDDGDVQLGDRVQIVQNSQGVAQAVRDSSRNPD